MSVTDRLNQVRQGVARAAEAAGRAPSDVQLVAVSKFHPLEAILACREAGQLHFGESRGQELRDKAAEAPELHWHFIGQIQTNKAKYIAPSAYRVHALESLRQAEALAKRAPRPLACLVEVNIGREAQKGGVLPEQVLDLCQALLQQGAIDLRGLMCIPPQVEDPADSAPFYEELADLAARGRERALPLHELSMGMSSDYEVAIAHGATWVRVGTAIFGPRDG